MITETIQKCTGIDMKFRDRIIKLRVFLGALTGPLVIAFIMAWHWTNGIRAEAENTVVVKSKSILLMAEATRNEMSRKLNLGTIKPFILLDPFNIVEKSRPTSVASAAQEMSVNINSVAAATEEASTNISLVSGATNGMAKTIRNTENAQKMSTNAVNEASETVVQIEQITNVINEVNYTVSIMVGDVEKRNKIIVKIAENVFQATIGAKEIAENSSQSSTIADQVLKDINTVSDIPA